MCCRFICWLKFRGTAATKESLKVCVMLTSVYPYTRLKCLLAVCPRISTAPWAGCVWHRVSNGKGVLGRTRRNTASSRPLQVTPLTANDARWPFLITAMCVQTLAPRAGNSTESTLGWSHATHTRGGVRRAIAQHLLPRFVRGGVSNPLGMLSPLTYWESLHILQLIIPLPDRHVRPGFSVLLSKNTGRRHPRLTPRQWSVIDR